MTDVQTTTGPMSRFLMDASKATIIVVLLFVFLVVAYFAIFRIGIPYANQEANRYFPASAQRTVLAQGPVDTTSRVVQPERVVPMRARPIRQTAPSQAPTPEPVRMELGELSGSGEVLASDVEGGVSVAGTTVDTGTGYRVYGQPVQRPNGTVCRITDSGQQLCVPGVCTTNPDTGRQSCRPT